MDDDNIGHYMTHTFYLLDTVSIIQTGVINV